jgi:hypothetical protein
MSLLKAYNLQKPVKYGQLKEEFQAVFADICEDTEATSIDDLADLLEIYAEYSVQYLQTVAVTLSDPSGVQDTMKYMNSIIAEVSRLVGVHYYHSNGSTLVDKPVQDALDDALTLEGIKAWIAEIEASYIEEDEVEETH